MELEFKMVKLELQVMSVAILDLILRLMLGNSVSPGLALLPGVAGAHPS